MHQHGSGSEAHNKPITQIFPRFLQNNTSEKLNLVRQLDIYMDEKNLMRCRGRIHNAPLDVDAKFPYLLPPKDRLTVLIIEHAHVTHLHSGLESTVAFFRKINGFPTYDNGSHPLFTDAPFVVRCLDNHTVPRVRRHYQRTDFENHHPFTDTGVDFTGALHIKGKGGNQEKVYICLFTCANTKAVHLELVSNLTEEAFLLAFRRFATICPRRRL